MNPEKFSGKKSEEAYKAGLEVKNIVVEYPAFKRAYDSCMSLVDVMGQLKIAAGLLLHAESGMGKTRLLDLVERGIKAASVDSLEKPCLSISLESVVDTHKMAARVMMALGYPMLPSRPNLENMNLMIDKGMARLKPKVLIVDEMQHICEGNRDITARAVTDWLKVRLDMYSLTFIGAGTRSLERLSLINPQFTSRVSANYMLDRFDYGESWRQLLAGFAAQCKSVNLDVLTGPIAKPLHTATRGNMRALKFCLIYASMHAANGPEARLTTNDLAKGYEDANGYVEGRANPLRVAH